MIEGGGSPVGLANAQRETVVLRDLNDRIVELRVEPLGTADVTEVVTMRFDILYRMVEVVADSTGLAITNRLVYDSVGSLVAGVEADGTPAARRFSSQVDERGLRIQSTQAMNTPEALVTQYEVDNGGSLVAVTDPSGSRSLFEWDGHDRRIGFTSRNGAQQTISYDAAGNPLSLLRVGYLPGSADLVQLEATYYHYDPLGRLYRTDRSLFDSDPTTGTLDDGNLMPGDGLVTELIIHDRLGRVVGHMDPDGDLSVWEYDGVHELRRRTDPMGNEVQLKRDLAGRVTERVSLELSSDPLRMFIETRGVLLERDSLGRILARTDDLGNREEFSWDWFSRLQSARDAKGNLTEWERDSLGRETRERRWISASGQGADASSADLTQAGGDGVVTLETTYDALSRVTARTDDHGNQTQWSHDVLSRVVREDRADGSFATWDWTPAGFLDTWRATNGSVTSYSRDLDGHLEAESIVRGPGVLGSTSRTYAIDSHRRR